MSLGCFLFYLIYTTNKARLLRVVKQLNKELIFACDMLIISLWFYVYILQY